MYNSEIKDVWYASRFTGLFDTFGMISPRPHDPDVFICSGMLPADAGFTPKLAVGGAGWLEEDAVAACAGEAFERVFSCIDPCDGMVFGTFSGWSLAESAVAPDRWVLFHPEQYRQIGFPFQPLTTETACRWVCFREAKSGIPYWVPAEFCYLFAADHQSHQIAPSISTGLACGRTPQHALLSGLQEVIERDAFVGGWWGSYAIEICDAEEVFRQVGDDVRRRVLRPNLQYGFYRIATPYSDHVTMVSLSGEDREGFVFSVGAACRQSRCSSWRKSLLEAIQGRHYVRYLKSRVPAAEGPRVFALTDFADHAVYYSIYPEQLMQTPLMTATASDSTSSRLTESLDSLVERLGSLHPVLFRNLTPAWLGECGTQWVVVRVLVPGLQPLHGNDSLPFLGGPLWHPRGLSEWGKIPPHPFP
ncbi:MAG: YcaO-like family protein [Planctomycetaceae bacterium]|jgi:ribosomal protein S12 methylthiotransferase accessory factor